MKSAKPPNVVFIIADDHRYSAIADNGDAIVYTPCLDALSRSGVSFHRNYIMGGMHAAVCVPTRACIHTGINPFRALAKSPGEPCDYSIEINHDLTLLGETFGNFGYTTHGIGKWHNGKASFNRSFQNGSTLFFKGMCDHNRVPIQSYDPTGRYPDGEIRIGGKFSSVLFADAAIDFLESRLDSEVPFFLYVAFTAPHDPRTPPALFRELYPISKIPLPPNFLPAHPFDNGELFVRDEQLAPHPRDGESVRKHLAEYYGMISHLDEQIGRIVDTVHRLCHREDTIIVYTADHGLSVGQHGLMGKQSLYEHSVRVPMILSGPKLPPGKRIDALTYTHDLFPTLCALCRLPSPGSAESKSLMPLIRGSRQSLCESVFAAYKRYQRMVCDGRWKLIEYRVHGEGHAQLFDLKNDPYEIEDLAGDGGQSSRIAALRELIIDWQRAVEDPVPFEFPDRGQPKGNKIPPAERDR